MPIDPVLRAMRVTPDLYAPITCPNLGTRFSPSGFATDGNSVTMLAENDTVDGSDVLPGFKVEVADLFAV